MTNLISNPEDLTTTWATVAAVVNANAKVAPDGTTTADRIIDDEEGGTSGVRVQQNLSGLPTSTDLVYSCFLAPDQLSWALLSMAAYDVAASGYVDISNASVGTLGAGVNDSGIIAFSDDWIRFWITWTALTDSSAFPQIYAADADGDSVVDRDGTSSIFAWGAVLEEGTEPSTYVSEAGITVTSSTPRIIRGVTSGVTRDVTKNLIDF